MLFLRHIIASCKKNREEHLFTDRSVNISVHIVPKKNKPQAPEHTIPATDGMGSAETPGAARILLAAQEIFARKGFAATSMREIAAAADVTKPMLYYYFASKDGLYARLLETALVQFRTLLESCLHAPLPLRERLILLCRLHYSIAQEREHLRFFSAAVVAPNPHPAAQELGRSVYRLNYNAVRTTLVEACAKGTITLEPQLLETAVLMVCGALSSFYDVSLHAVHYPDDNIIESMVDMLCSGLAGNHSSTKGHRK